MRWKYLIAAVLITVVILLIFLMYHGFSFVSTWNTKFLGISWAGYRKDNWPSDQDYKVGDISLVHLSSPSSGAEQTNLSSATSPLLSSRQELRHLFFLKVHKSASSTILNLVYRFVMSRELVVMLPKRDMDNILSETSFAWTHNAAPLPFRAGHFDVLCNHIVFHEASVRRAMPEDTTFVAVVRHPFQQFVSAFRYFSHKQYLASIPGEDPITTYLESPRGWEPPDARKSYTNNRMSVDFGMDPSRLQDAGYVRDYVKDYLGGVFHLVMVSDRFDESVLLLRRLMGWKMKDVIYISNNVRSSGGGGKGEVDDRRLLRKAFTAREKGAHEEFNVADYILYQHFAKALDDKVRAAGEAFAGEVRVFKAILKAVSGYCLGNNNNSSSNDINKNSVSSKTSHSNSSNTEKVLMVRATLWNEKFWVTRDDCKFLLMDEKTFLRVLRLANADRIN